jgi:hypothetical protein
MALLLAVPALGVGACGGNDDSASETSVARTSGQQNTAGPQTGATGTSRTGGARSERAGQQKQGSGKESGGGGNRSNTGSARSNTGSARSNTGSAAPTAPTARKKQAKKEYSPDAEELKRQVGPELAKQAHELCKALAEQSGNKSGKPDDVARDYAASYPVAIRRQVAAGCKAGILEAER